MTRRTRRAHKRTPGSADPFARKRLAATRQRDARRSADDPAFRIRNATTYREEYAR